MAYSGRQNEPEAEHSPVRCVGLKAEAVLTSYTTVKDGRIAVLGCLLVGLGVAACRPSRESMSAGQVGCNPNEIEISNEDSSTGWGQSSETWTAVCAGRVFICSQNTSSSSGVAVTGTTVSPVIVSGHDSVSCHEQLASVPSAPSAAAAAAAARPVVAPTAAAPSGGAGFLLGAAPDATQQVCEAAGNTWEAPNKGRAQCSGPAADLGFPADVAIKFCSGKACMITVHHRPTSEWSGTFSELKGKLTEKYGAPSESQAVVPPVCRSEAGFVECVTEKGVRLHFAWSWPTGERVILSVGKTEAESDAAIRIDYTKPVRKVAANASAL